MTLSPPPSSEDLARYWGILNRCRSVALGEPWTVKRVPWWVSAAVILLLLGVGGALSLAPGRIMAFTHDVVGAYPGSEAVVLSFFGGLAAFIGGLVSAFWALRKRQYAQRHQGRDAWQAALSAFAHQRTWQSWVGHHPYRAEAATDPHHVDWSYETGRVKPVLRFLETYWPAQAPRLLLTPPPKQSHAPPLLATLTATHNGLPFLVHLADNEARASTTLFVMVARPLAVSQRPLQPGDTAPGQALQAAGFRVFLTLAGVIAILEIPIQDPHRSQEAKALDDGVRAVFDLAALSPTGSPIAAPVVPPESLGVDSAGYPRPTAYTFLTALKNQDDLGALAQTNILHFEGTLEPSYLEAVSGLRRVGQPTSWREHSTGWAGEQEEASMHWFDMQFTDGKEWRVLVSVSLFQYQWLVEGVSVSHKTVVGNSPLPRSLS